MQSQRSMQMQMTKLSIAVVLGVLMSSMSPVYATDIKIATIAPNQSAWMGEMRDAAKLVKERTNGRVNLKFYGGGVQGTPPKVLQKIKIGQLHGGMFAPMDFVKTYGDINLYGLPMTFQSANEARYVRSRMDSRLIEGLEEQGFICFGFSHTGFAIIMSSVPIHGVDDLKGKKVWVPEGDTVSYESLIALGVSPQPLPLTDVLMGLETELIDIVPVSSIGALFMQWHTSVDYITDMPLVYTYGFLAIQKKAFNEINAHDQLIVREVIARIYRESDEVGADVDEEAKQALFDSGIYRIVPEEAEIARIRRIMAESNRNLTKTRAITEALYDEVLRHIDEYRSQQESGGVGR